MQPTNTTSRGCSLPFEKRPLTAKKDGQCLYFFPKWKRKAKLSQYGCCHLMLKKSFGAGVCEIVIMCWSCCIKVPNSRRPNHKLTIITPHPIFIASNNWLKLNLSEKKKTLEYTSAWWELPKMLETIFGKNVFKVWLDFSFGSRPIGLHGEGRVYDLYCSQPLDGNQKALASHFRGAFPKSIISQLWSQVPSLPTWFNDSVAASENLGSWLAASLPYEAMTLQAAFLHEGTSQNWFLRQRNGLMFYNKIERVLVITKQIFNYYNTNFSLEITSKVQKVNQKYTFTHKLTTKRNFQTPSLFLAQPSWNGTHRIVG